MLKVGAQARVGEHLDSTLKKIGEILFDADDVEKRSARFDVDEQINVALGSVIATRKGAEHTDISYAVTGRELKNVTAMRAQMVDRHATIITACGQLVSASTREARESEVEAAGVELFRSLTINNLAEKLSVESGRTAQSAPSRYKIGTAQP